jgi:hypothetical protein
MSGLHRNRKGRAGPKVRQASGLCCALAMSSLGGACATSGGSTGIQEFGDRANYKVTVVSASISASRPDGQPWHTQEPGPGVNIVKSLATLSRVPLLPEVIDAFAQERGRSASVSPSPLVEVHVGKLVLDSGPIRTTLRPQWNWSFALDPLENADDDPITFVVRDADGQGELGRYQTNVGKLIEKRNLQESAGPSVGLLQISAEPMEEPRASHTYQFAVPANQSMLSLVLRARAGASSGWVPIPLLNGDSIRIEAKGNATIHPGILQGVPFSEPSDPDGLPPSGRGRPNPIPECAELPHSALVAAFAGECKFIGRRFEARNIPRAGQLLLGINDTDVGNDQGGYEVTVWVNPPDLMQPSSAPQ